jgi:uncharacterized membrane protein YqaE (UPF0057 family)
MKKIFTRLLMVAFAITIACSPAFSINVTDLKKDEGNPDAKTVQTAVTEFKSLSKKEKKERFKQIRKTIKDYKANKSAEASTNTLLLVILAILLPPLAVYLHEGVINSKFWIDLILTLLLWLPGVIYALIVILA